MVHSVWRTSKMSCFIANISVCVLRIQIISLFANRSMFSVVGNIRSSRSTDSLTLDPSWVQICKCHPFITSLVFASMACKVIRLSFVSVITGYLTEYKHLSWLHYACSNFDKIDRDNSRLVTLLSYQMLKIKKTVERLNLTHWGYSRSNASTKDGWYR